VVNSFAKFGKLFSLNRSALVTRSALGVIFLMHYLYFFINFICLLIPGLHLMTPALEGTIFASGKLLIAPETAWR